jgi:hypothetical protein
VADKVQLLARIAALLPDVPHLPKPASGNAASTSELVAERDRLDAAIVDVLTLLYARKRDGDAAAHDEALELIRDHLHDEVVREMKLIRKPLFAEIASGGAAKAAD